MLPTLMIEYSASLKSSTCHCCIQGFQDPYFLHFHLLSLDLFVDLEFDFLDPLD
jgi:hypothetical protein